MRVGRLHAARSRCRTAHGFARICPTTAALCRDGTGDDTWRRHRPDDLPRIFHEVAPVCAGCISVNRHFRPPVCRSSLSRRGCAGLHGACGRGLALNSSPRPAGLGCGRLAQSASRMHPRNPRAPREISGLRPALFVWRACKWPRDEADAPFGRWWTAAAAVAARRACAALAARRRRCSGPQADERVARCGGDRERDGRRLEQFVRGHESADATR